MRPITIRVDEAKLAALRETQERCGIAWPGDEIAAGIALDIGLTEQIKTMRLVAEWYERTNEERPDANPA